MSHLLGCEDSQLGDAPHALQLDLWEGPVAGHVHGVHVGCRATWTEKAISIPPTDQQAQLGQHNVLHEHKHWGHLIGIPPGRGQGENFTTSSSQKLKLLR